MHFPLPRPSLSTQRLLGKLSALSLLFFLMGSVGEDYRCPLCGRTGMGGYSPDWIGFPICTEGDYNCLDKVCPSDTSDDATPFAADVVVEALGKIIGGVRAFKQYPEARMRSKSSLLRHVASVLVFDMQESIQAGEADKARSQAEDSDHSYTNIDASGFTTEHPEEIEKRIEEMSEAPSQAK